MEVEVETPARVETWVDVELVRGDEVRGLASRVIPRSEWAFWDPRWKRESLRMELEAEQLRAPAGGRVRLRASAQPGRVWFWQRPPVVKEIDLPVAAP